MGSTATDPSAYDSVSSEPKEPMDLSCSTLALLQESFCNLKRSYQSLTSEHLRMKSEKQELLQLVQHQQGVISRMQTEQTSLEQQNSHNNQLVREQVDAMNKLSLLKISLVESTEALERRLEMLKMREQKMPIARSAATFALPTPSTSMTASKALPAQAPSALPRFTLPSSSHAKGPEPEPAASPPPLSSSVALPKTSSAWLKPMRPSMVPRKKLYTEAFQPQVVSDSLSPTTVADARTVKLAKTPKRVTISDHVSIFHDRYDQELDMRSDQGPSAASGVASATAVNQCQVNVGIPSSLDFMLGGFSTSR